MAIGEEQVVEMAVALQARRLPDDQIRALHQAIDAVYNDLRWMCELCLSSDVPDSVRQPLLETAQDMGRVRIAFLRARQVIKGDSRW
jgi:hypothetical protein